MFLGEAAVSMRHPGSALEGRIDIGQALGVRLQREPPGPFLTVGTYPVDLALPLALRIHIGMWRYTRNVVSAALTPGAPDWDGMAILHFRTAEDLRERFYDSDAGRRAIAEDVAKFSGAGKALHTSEWILKGPPAD